MMQPKILLSGGVRTEYYVDAVTHCGGIAQAQYLPEVSADYDGLILCGGSDIDPSYYGEKENGAVAIDRERDACELALTEAFVAAKKPILGICRGCQLLNVFFGGSLIQHLDTTSLHSADGDAVHSIASVNDSIASHLYGAAFSVNSHHHQAVKDVGGGLRVTHFSEEDGVVEGIEHALLPILGVQWHPERMCLKEARADTVNGIEIFRFFVQRCLQDLE